MTRIFYIPSDTACIILYVMKTHQCKPCHMKLDNDLQDTYNRNLLQYFHNHENIHRCPFHTRLYLQREHGLSTKIHIGFHFAFYIFKKKKV